MASEVSEGGLAAGAEGGVVCGLLLSGVSSLSSSSEIAASRAASCIGGQGNAAGRSSHSKMHKYGKAEGGAPFISVEWTVESSALYLTKMVGGINISQAIDKS